MQGQRSKLDIHDYAARDVKSVYNGGINRIGFGFGGKHSELCPDDHAHFVDETFIVLGRVKVFGCDGDDVFYSLGVADFFVHP